MKTFFSDLIPRLQKYSRKLDDLTLLTDQHWVLIDDIDNLKNVFIFKNDNVLLLSKNGSVLKGNWEYLGNNSLLLDLNPESYLYKHGFFDDNILALKIDGKKEYTFLVNENKYDGELNNLASIFKFLEEKYLDKVSSEMKQSSTGKQIDDSDIRGNYKKIEKKLNDGRILTIYSSSDKTDEFNIGDKVSINGRIPKDGNYHYGWTGGITIQNGVIRW